MRVGRAGSAEIAQTVGLLSFTPVAAHVVQVGVVLSGAKGERRPGQAGNVSVRIEHVVNLVAVQRQHYFIDVVIQDHLVPVGVANAGHAAVDRRIAALAQDQKAPGGNEQGATRVDNERIRILVADGPPADVDFSVGSVVQFEPFATVVGRRIRVFHDLRDNNNSCFGDAEVIAAAEAVGALSASLSAAVRAALLPFAMRHAQCALAVLTLQGRHAGRVTDRRAVLRERAGRLGQTVHCAIVESRLRVPSALRVHVGAVDAEGTAVLAPDQSAECVAATLVGFHELASDRARLGGPEALRENRAALVVDALPVCGACAAILTAAVVPALIACAVRLAIAFPFLIAEGELESDTHPAVELASAAVIPRSAALLVQ